MSSDSLPAFQEPRKYFLALLIRKVYDIYDVIYDDRHPTHALDLMSGILAMLTEEHKKKLDELKKEIDLYRSTNRCSRQQIETSFSKLNDYLGLTYFKEFSFAMPMNPHPKRITVDSATIKKTPEQIEYEKEAQNQ
jgi:hypothetical protein